METSPRLIYCGRSNKTLDPLALVAGWEYGLRLPFTAHYPPVFADQNWKKPDRQRYVRAVAKYRPEIATVLDWEYPEQEEEVFSWAWEIVPYVSTVVIIPKVPNVISRIPKQLNGKEVRLGYSVPTKHGSTPIKVSEFKDRPVHLLGGHPHIQIMLARRMNVVSADCNYHSLKANKHCEVWTCEGTRRWIPVSRFGVAGNNSNKIAFLLSCITIKRAWGVVSLGGFFSFENKPQYVRLMRYL